MVTDAQKRASAKYKAEKTKAFTLRFYPAEADLVEHLEAQPNKQGYIKRLIAEDMGKTRPN